MYVYVYRMGRKKAGREKEGKEGRQIDRQKEGGEHGEKYKGIL